MGDRTDEHVTGGHGTVDQGTGEHELVNIGGFIGLKQSTMHGYGDPKNLTEHRHGSAVYNHTEDKHIGVASLICRHFPHAPKVIQEGVGVLCDGCGRVAL